MWLLIFLLAVSLVITALVRRRGRDTRDSVDDQRKRLEALRAATSGSNAPAGEMGGGVGGSRSSPARERTLHVSGRAALIAVGVVVAGVALYAIAAGWDSGSTGDSDEAGPQSTRASTTTTSSSTTTTTTTPPAVAITGSDGDTVTIAVPSGPYRLGITARDSCWMLVERADGTVVDTTTLEEGDAREFEEAGPVSVQLGNPGGVDVVINDQPLVLPPGNGNAMELQITPVA
jgi:hypothetical protein